METIFLKLLQCHGIKLIKLIRLRQEVGESVSTTHFSLHHAPPTTTTTLLGVFQDKKAGYFEWQLITTPSSSPSNLMRQKLCVFPCLCECACAGFSVYLNTREVAFPSRAATMACLPMLLFVSIFTFAYAVRCLSYARGFLSQHSLSSSHSHAFHSRTHACTHTHSPAIVSSWIQCSRSNYGKPTHRLCTSVMAGEEDKKNCGGMQVKAVCSAQTMTARTLIFILFYLLDKWKAKTQLWHASTSHDLCSPLEREK